MKKPWISVVVWLLGISTPACLRGWNVLSNGARPYPIELVATVDLKGSPCVVDLKKHKQKCQPKLSAAPVQVKVTRDHTTYPTGELYGKLQVMRPDDSTSMWNVEEYKIAEDGSGFRMVKLEFKTGKNGWLEIHTLEHALPGKNDKDFMPGPPLARRYVFDGIDYVPGK